MVPKSQEMCLSINTKYKHIFYTLFFTLCETKHSTFNVKVPIYILEEKIEAIVNVIRPNMI